MIKAEVITIGDEILFGQITDTNTQWLSAELDKIGIKTIRKTSIGDAENDILEILHEASQRANVIIITGGLGPTKDDITKKALAKFFKSHLLTHHEALDDLKAFFQKRGKEVTGLNFGQAELPENATYIKNNYGTAPGMWFDEANCVYISLPGVPYEMKGIMQDTLLEKLRKRFNSPLIVHEYIKTVGISESILAEQLAEIEENLPENLKLAYLPSVGGVKLRLTGIGSDALQIQEKIDDAFGLIIPKIKEHIYALQDIEIGESMGQQLQARHQTVATAESCTGGYLSHLFTKVAGSSAYFLGGIISYSNEVKVNQLGVNESTLTNHGAVSEQTVAEMAEGVRKKLGATYGLATSGIAGPTGGTAEKPVGTIWIALATEKGTITKKLTLGGQREQNIELTAIIILNLLRQNMIN